MRGDRRPGGLGGSRVELAQAFSAASVKVGTPLAGQHPREGVWRAYLPKERKKELRT